MGSINPSKTTTLALNKKAISGVEKYFAHVKTLTVAGATHTPQSLAAVFQSEIDANTALEETLALVKQQVAAARVARAKARSTRKGLKTYLLGTTGADAVQMLDDFGMSAPKPTGPRTAKSKAEAVDAAEATRKAKKEALATIGTIDATPPTPPTAPNTVAAQAKA
jgi:hypothetical protein